MNEIAALSKEDITEIMMDLGAKARTASHGLATASAEQKNTALSAMARAIRGISSDILAANEKDMSAAAEKNLKDSFKDRLLLTPDRIEAIAKGVEEIALLGDPVGETSAQWDRPNGLNISRVRVPLGVIGIIYESRPNVTVDAGALCLKSGNAVILRGGSESFHSSSSLVRALHAGLEEAELPLDAIQMVPTTDRNAVSSMLTGLDGNLDVIIPRGGKSLIERIQNEARIPVFSHLEGICHVYIDASAKLDMAIDVVMNAKLRRTGICGAAETLLIDTQAAKTHLIPVTQALIDAGCEIRGDEASIKLNSDIQPASEEDWSTEYLDSIISLKIVDGVNEAVNHIEKYGSHHTDAVLTEDSEVAASFLNNVHSAIVMHNTSTQFADGGEFGMGAEIGIATGKMHARGPVGVEQLTTYKYVVRSDGQTRP